MADTDNKGLGLDDSDHLPWLETADDYEYDNSPSIFKILLWVFLAILLIALGVASYVWYGNRNNEEPTQGDGELIVAQEGNYKIPPEDEQGKQFEGEGDASFAVTEGQKVSSQIGEQAKDPVLENQVKPAGESVAGSVVAGSVVAGSVAVQLGAFSDTTSASAAWSNLSKRFGFLSNSQRKIIEGSVDGGRKIYRLQAIAPNLGQANDICSKLKAAGENCLVVK